MKAEKEKLLKLAANPNNIAGIYNYCDNWCENCAFTKRCFQFLMNKEDVSTDNNFSNKEKLWDDIKNSLNMAVELIDDLAEQMKIDLNDSNHEEYKNHHRKKNEELIKNPLVTRGFMYSRLVQKWFDKNNYLFLDKGREMEKFASFGFDKKSVEDHLYKLQDILENIFRYQYFIPAKISRAVGAIDIEIENPQKNLPKDSDGSAKIALITIHKSIDAWAELNKIFPQKEDEILEILVLLKKLLNETNKIFPNAMSFIRPGFDE